MTKKMTNKKAIAYVLENVSDLPEEVVEKLESMLATLENKTSTANRKLTKTQQENELLRESILAFMESDPNRMMTCTEIGKAIPELNEANNQKISALMRGLVEAGKVTKATEKGKSYFKYANEGEMGE